MTFKNLAQGADGGEGGCIAESKPSLVPPALVGIFSLLPRTVLDFLRTLAKILTPTRVSGCSAPSTFSSPSRIGLNKPIAADVARATRQTVDDWKAVEESYALKSVGRASLLSFVMAKITLKCISLQLFATVVADIRFRARSISKKHVFV